MRRMSYERAQRRVVVLTTSIFSTRTIHTTPESFVACTLFGFATCKVRTTPGRMSHGCLRDVHSTLHAKTLSHMRRMSYVIVKSTACRIDDIGFRDVHTMHDAETKCRIWTPSSFATDASVVWAPYGFCDVHSTHTSACYLWTPSGFAKCTLHTRCTVQSLSYKRHRVSRRAQYSRRQSLVSYGRR